MHYTYIQVKRLQSFSVASPNRWCHSEYLFDDSADVRQVVQVFESNILVQIGVQESTSEQFHADFVINLLGMKREQNESNLMGIKGTLMDENRIQSCIYLRIAGNQSEDRACSTGRGQVSSKQHLQGGVLHLYCGQPIVSIFLHGSKNDGQGVLSGLGLGSLALLDAFSDLLHDTTSGFQALWNKGEPCKNCLWS